MEVQEFIKGNQMHMKQGAELLMEAFPQSYRECADDEIKKLIDGNRILIAALDNDRLVGFVGAIPQYGTTAWSYIL